MTWKKENYKSLNRHWWILPRQTPLQLDRDGIKEREDGEKDRGGGCAIIPGRGLFYIFLCGGGGGRLFEGRLLFEEIRCSNFASQIVLKIKWLATALWYEYMEFARSAGHGLLVGVSKGINVRTFKTAKNSSIKHFTLYFWVNYFDYLRDIRMSSLSRGKRRWTPPEIEWRRRTPKKRQGNFLFKAGDDIPMWVKNKL